jgi:hypothetical protein
MGEWQARPTVMLMAAVLPTGNRDHAESKEKER